MGAVLLRLVESPGLRRGIFDARAGRRSPNPKDWAVNGPSFCDSQSRAVRRTPRGGLQLDEARCTHRWRRTVLIKVCPRTNIVEWGSSMGRAFAVLRTAGPVAQRRSRSGGWATGRTWPIWAVLVAEFLRPNGSRGPKPPAAEARNSTLLLGPAGFSPSKRVG